MEDDGAAHGFDAAAAVGELTTTPVRFEPLRGRDITRSEAWKGTEAMSLAAPPAP